MTLLRKRKPNVTSTATVNSLALAEYDDPDAYVQTMPQREPLLVTLPPLPPNNDTKEVYETVQQQDDGSLVVVNPRANTSGYEVVVRQEDPVSGVVLTADGRSALYDTITDGGQPLQVIYESIETQYHYVPNEVNANIHKRMYAHTHAHAHEHMQTAKDTCTYTCIQIFTLFLWHIVQNSRKQGTLSRPPSGLEDELRSIVSSLTPSSLYYHFSWCSNIHPVQYGGVTKPEFEDQPFVSPGKKLNTIYGQLADKKCIEIPRSYLK